MKISGVSNFPTGLSTINLNNGSTVEYNRTGNQTISPRTYSHLSLLGSGVKTTNGVAVTGILSLQGDVTTLGIIVPNVASTIVSTTEPLLSICPIILFLVTKFIA